MDECLGRYEKLLKEFNEYQALAEEEIQKLSKQNMKLERDINTLSNIIEISKAINSSLNDENLISKINDIIIGVLGAVNSTIYLKENSKLEEKSMSLSEEVCNLTKEEKKHLINGEAYLINSKKAIRTYGKTRLGIKSVMGMPIKLKEQYLGFIIVEHTIYNYFLKKDEKFLATICNQIAVGIENSILYTKLREAAKKDPLLDIFNRKHFFKMVLKKEEENPDNVYAIVMVDLDDFKKVNDNYGHQFGDKVLIEITNLIKNMIGEEDIIARYGGEEIIIYINNVINIESVYYKIEKIRKNVEQTIIKMDEISRSVTASFGIACFRRDGDNINEVIKIADECLYESKRNGKNKVTMKNFY